jgi:hypothetical protein
MAQNNSLKRNYTFADTKLERMASLLAATVLDDIDKFANYGVTEAVVDSFKSLIENSKNTPTDIEFSCLEQSATEDKDNLAENLRAGIRTVRTIAANKWGIRDAKYRSYGFDGMSGLSDEKLHRLGKRTIKLASQQLADLASEGLTQAFIDNLQNTNNDFDESIDLQAEAEINRDIATQDRILAGNTLFKEVMRLSKIGQDIFASTNAVKYKFYLVYHKKKENSDEKKVSKAIKSGSLPDSKPTK